MCRAQLIVILNEIGINGRNIRSIIDDFEFGIAYEGIFSEPCPVNDGNPQGRPDSGPFFNLITEPIIRKCLEALKTISFDNNFSCSSFADDGIKIATTLRRLQKLIDTEANEQKKYNLKCNAKKTVICKYSRHKKAREEFKSERDIVMNGTNIVWTTEMNKAKFLGFKLDFNQLDFLSNHREEKLKTFKSIRHSLYFKRIIGYKMPIDIQIRYYLKCVRPAFLFGIRCIDTSKTKMNNINSLQRSYLSTILGTHRNTNSTAIRILLGIPKLSDHIIKLKLSMYYDIHKQTDNIFAQNIARSHKRLRTKYKEYNNKIEDITPRWQYSTSDWITDIDTWKLPDKYKNPQHLPPTKRKWVNVLDKKINEIYKSKLETFLKTNGQMIAIIFGHDILWNKHKRFVYNGFIDEIQRMYSNDTTIPSTETISDSINLLINSTKLKWFPDCPNRREGMYSGVPAGITICPWCKAVISGNTAVHMIKYCSKVKRPDDMEWTIESTDFKKNIRFLKAMQRKLDDLKSLSEVDCNTD